MTKWEFTALVSTKLHDVTGSLLNVLSIDVRQIWLSKDEKTGKSDWDVIKEFGSEGWELVSVTPLAGVNGQTVEVLFTFKRPVEDGQ